MALKKSPQAELENKRLLFFEIGLLVSLLIVVLLFSWGKSDVIVELPVFETEMPIEEIVEVTRQDFRLPTPQKQHIRVLSEILQIVKDDTHIATEIAFDEFAEDVIFAEASRGSGALSEVVDFGDDIFVKVEDEPKFLGKSWETFPYWVAQKIQYPKAAIKNNIQGRVMVRFVIEKNGTLSNIEVISSPNPILSEEALRVIKSSPPQWTPGKQRNTPVRVRFEVPVDFKLQ